VRYQSPAASQTKIGGTLIARCQTITMCVVEAEEHVERIPPAKKFKAWHI